MNDATLFTRRQLLVLIAASMGFLAASSAMAQSPADSASLKWSMPTTMPPSARVAVVNGDPTGPGETTFLISMPNGYRIPPHYHPSDVNLEVMEGTLLVGMGDELDPKQAKRLAAGDSASVPAGTHHFWIASGRTVATMKFIGPFTITYLRAEDAPRPRAFPFGY
jgi:quercetin dioxygenase-like cupin family protein